MSSLDDLQRRVGEWGKQTFPHSTRSSIIAHLRREAEELDAATNSREDREECADILLLLLHLAHRMGFSLQEAAGRKFGQCLVREWMPPDEEGVSEHKR